jgi:hypothetical protein
MKPVTNAQRDKRTWQAYLTCLTKPEIAFTGGFRESVQ